MDGTPTLFDYVPPAQLREPIARRTDPETSHEAAATAGLHASQGRLLVMRCLTREPLTDFELAAKTGWQQTSIGKRRHECMQAGLVRKMERLGSLIKRPSPSGSPAIVWEITDKGRAWYAQEVA